MSDSEDADFFVESWAPPQTVKGKNALKEGKKHQTLKSRTAKTGERGQDKKKSLAFKKAMVERKEKKKEKSKEKKKGKKKGKKRKKHKLALELDDHFTFTQASSAQATLKEKSAAANPRKKEKLHTDDLGQDSVKKTKRKKIVAFGLSPTYIRVKRPKFASSSPKEMEVAGDGESRVQVTVTGHGQLDPYDNDCQCSGEDNSQDLFITQKTFRASPPELSSSEASQRAATASLRVFTQLDKDPHRAGGEIKRCPRESGEQMETQVNLSEDMHEPVIANHIPAAVSSKRRSLRPPCISESALLSPCSRSTWTQTENFFTAELSSYASFCHKSRVTVDVQTLKPLDLSLPHRVRKDLCLSVKMSLIDRNIDIEELLDGETLLLPGEIQNATDVSSSGSPQATHTDIKNESYGQVETTLSPKSEADPRSADMTASSEDDHSCRTGKRDLIQVRAVQTRLNKPFFFKTKGEAQSPRPESPLMKLSQGRDVKIKKRH